jgi:hypothetical protein
MHERLEPLSHIQRTLVVESDVRETLPRAVCLIDSGHEDAAAWALANLGILLNKQGDTAGARAAYQQAINTLASRPTAPSAWDPARTRTRQRRGTRRVSASHRCGERANPATSRGPPCRTSNSAQVGVSAFPLPPIAAAGPACDGRLAQPARHERRSAGAQERPHRVLTGHSPPPPANSWWPRRSVSQRDRPTRGDSIGRWSLTESRQIPGLP